MAVLKSQVSALLSSGADATDNIYDVVINLPGAVTSALVDEKIITQQQLETSLTLRCQGFDPPKFTLKLYDTPYKTTRIKRPAGKIDGDRLFKLQFRLDAYYSIYRALLAWRAGYMQPSSGFAGTAITELAADKSSYLGQIQVFALDSPPFQSTGNGYSAAGITEDTINPSTVSTLLAWNFNDVWVADVSDPIFKTGNGEVQIITATFAFSSFRDPQAYDAVPPLYANAIIPAQPTE